MYLYGMRSSLYTPIEEPPRGGTLCQKTCNRDPAR
jgi:hypothetical protein